MDNHNSSHHADDGEPYDFAGCRKNEDGTYRDDRSALEDFQVRAAEVVHAIDYPGHTVVLMNLPRRFAVPTSIALALEEDESGGRVMGPIKLDGTESNVAILYLAYLMILAYRTRPVARSFRVHGLPIFEGIPA